MSTLRLFGKVPDVGTTVPLVQRFETHDYPSQPIDPDTVQLRTTSPTGVEVSWTVQQDAPGWYSADVLVDESGQWLYRWDTVGPVRAYEGSFVVRRSLFDTFGAEPPVLDPPYTWNELLPFTWDDLRDLTWDELGGEGLSMGDTYIFEQATPLASWLIVHNLNRFPAVTVEDQDGNPVLVAPNYDGPNQLTLTFNPPLQGVAYLN